MLTKEKIKSNATKFFKTGEKYEFMTEELMNFLGADVIAAPATTKLDSYNAFEGGLIDHSLRTTSYAVKLNGLLPEDMQCTMESVVKVACLFQIGKTFMFLPNTSQWHKDKLGQMYEFADDLVALRVGERSVKYAVDNGVRFTDDEYQAIINYDKTDEDKQAMFHTNTLGIILRQASDLAIMEEKKRLLEYA